MSDTFAVRPAGGRAAIIDLEGDITAQTEMALMEAYARASVGGVQLIILDFRGNQKLIYPKGRRVLQIGS